MFIFYELEDVQRLRLMYVLGAMKTNIKSNLSTINLWEYKCNRIFGFPSFSDSVDPECRLPFFSHFVSDCTFVTSVTKAQTPKRERYKIKKMLLPLTVEHLLQYHYHCSINTGCFFFTGPPPKKLKYGKPRLG